MGQPLDLYSANCLQCFHALLIAVPVNALHCRINEVLLTIFLSLREIGKLQQSVGSDKYYYHHLVSSLSSVTLL
jgi:hypothetical protein